MFGALSVIAGIYTGYQLIKEACEQPIPTENWGDMDAYNKDLMSGVPIEQCLKNVRNGKYKSTEKHPEPHRDSKTGQIIIENCTLYKKDIAKYGAYQTYKWAKQGKYNLNTE